MSWRRVRDLATGALVLAALLLGGVVGNSLLLGRVDHNDSGVGQLSARLAAPPATRTVVTTAPPTTPGSTTEERPRAGADSEAGDRGKPDD